MAARRTGRPVRAATPPKGTWTCGLCPAQGAVTEVTGTAAARVDRTFADEVAAAARTGSPRPDRLLVALRETAAEAVRAHHQGALTSTDPVIRNAHARAF